MGKLAQLFIFLFLMKAFR